MGREMCKFQISEAQARDMISGLIDSHYTEDAISSFKKFGYIKKSALEEARGYFSDLNDRGLISCEIKELKCIYEKAITEIQNKGEQNAILNYCSRSKVSR